MHESENEPWWMWPNQKGDSLDRRQATLGEKRFSLACFVNI